MKKWIFVFFLISFLLASSFSLEAPRSTPGTDATDKMVKDQTFSTQSLLENKSDYAWDLFLWLNSPENSSAKRWENWKPTSEVFLDNGATPRQWDTKQQPAQPQESVMEKARKMRLDMSRPFHNLDAYIQVDGLPLMDKWKNKVRYQLLMNQHTFEYILDKGIFNIDGQVALAASKQEANFPWSSWELKTSWIWLGDDNAYSEVKPYYYVVNAYYQKFDRDGNPDGWEVGRAAMAGMHIINKTLPNWVWITFENVKNKQFTKAKLELPIDPETLDANNRYKKDLLKKHSILANYQLDGLQTTFTNEPKTEKATLLANSTIESAFQPQSSCISCHAVAAVNEQGAYFDLSFTKNGHLSYYTGDVKPQLYKTKGYFSLDFVFSLKRAYRKR